MSQEKHQLRDKYYEQRNSLYEKALSGVDGALKRTKEVLLWRGFLVMEIKNKLYLSSGSHPEDEDMLRSFYVNIQKEPKPKKTGIKKDWWQEGQGALFPMDTDSSQDNVLPRYSLGEIEPIEDEDILRKIFVTPPIIIGFCSPSYFPGQTETDFRSFLMTRFGRKVPVEVLDPGVALLVKSLPLLGLDTAMSCEGHIPDEIQGNISSGSYFEVSEHDDTTVWFFSKYHLKWAKRVVPQFLPEGDPFITQWTFEDKCEWWRDCEWRLAPKGSITNFDEKFEIFNNIQRLARGILDSHWDKNGHFDPENSLARRIRDSKKQLSSEQDLDNLDKQSIR